MFNYAETCEILANLGTTRTKAHWSDFIIRSFLAGVMLTFSFIFGAVMKKDSSYTYSYQGVPIASSSGQSGLFGLGFSLGLMFIVLTNCYLFTGDVSSVACAWFLRRISFWTLLNTWGWVYLFNIVGSVFAAFLLGWASGLMRYPDKPYGAFLWEVCHSKATLPYHEMFVRGICCNWLVCIATFLSCMNKGYIGKCVGIGMGITLFATVGYEHCVANWNILSMGMMQDGGIDNITWKGYWLNLIIVTLGNIVGGVVFVAAPAAYMVWLPKKLARKSQAKKENEDQKLSDAGSSSASSSNSYSSDKKGEKP